MKKTYLSLVFLVTILAVKAQTAIPETVVKFTQFYKANQPDSIFTLFSPEMKTALKLAGTQQLVSQVKGQLGEIVKTRAVDAPASGYLEFRLSFERPLVDLALVIKDNLIAGIQQKAVELAKNDPVELASPDNFLVKNAFGNLYGTLTLPKTGGKVPVVLMIAGSGPTDRNMNQGQAMKSNAFLMLAKALAENGIATVRYDKRGLGKSSAALVSADVKLDDFITDADLFIAKLKEDPRFSKVVVLGHSEGATIGLIASLASKPDAFISVSGIGSDITVILKKQLKTAASPEDYKISTEILDSLKAGKVVNRKLSPALERIFAPSIQPYLMSMMKYNTLSEMGKLKMPVLVVGGTTDLQVSIDEAKQLAKANPKATLKVVTGMNHVLKAAPAERMANLQTYNSPELALHPELVPLLADFVKQIAK